MTRLALLAALASLVLPSAAVAAGPVGGAPARAPIAAIHDGTQLALFGRGGFRSRYSRPYSRGFGRTPYRRRGFGRGFFHGLFWGWMFSHLFGYGFGFGIPFFPILILMLLALFMLRRRSRYAGPGGYGRY